MKSFNLPDTFAGGQFNLPLQIAKLVRLADSTNEHERFAVIKKLWDKGYFLDMAGIIWDKNRVPEIVRKNDTNYTNLAGVN